MNKREQEETEARARRRETKMTNPDVDYFIKFSLRHIFGTFNSYESDINKFSLRRIFHFLKSCNIDKKSNMQIFYGKVDKMNSLSDSITTCISYHFKNTYSRTSLNRIRYWQNFAYTEKSSQVL